MIHYTNLTSLPAWRLTVIYLSLHMIKHMYIRTPWYKSYKCIASYFSSMRSTIWSHCSYCPMRLILSMIFYGNYPLPANDDITSTCTVVGSLKPQTRLQFVECLSKLFKQSHYHSSLSKSSQYQFDIWRHSQRHDGFSSNVMSCSAWSLWNIR